MQNKQKKKFNENDWTLVIAEVSWCSFWTLLAVRQNYNTVSTCFVHHIYTSMLIISLQEIPKQNNGIDCGVFICQVLI